MTFRSLGPPPRNMGGKKKEPLSRKQELDRHLATCSKCDIDLCPAGERLKEGA